MLRAAVERGDIARSRELLSAGADPNASASNGRSALHSFFSGRNWRLERALLDLLLQHGADPDLRDSEGCTALHRAVERGHVGLVEILLDHKADGNLRDARGRSSLHVAVQHSSDSILSLLLMRGADADVRDAEGRTPLHLAQEKKALAMGLQLVAARADPEIADDEGRIPIVWLASQCGLAAQKKQRGETLSADERACLGYPRLVSASLYQAAAAGDLAEVNALLGLGADPNAAFAFHPGRSTRASALHVAALEGHAPAVAALLERGAGLEVPDGMGWTPLHLAVWKARKEVVALLLERGARPEHKTRSGRSALDLARERAPELLPLLRGKLD
ncbi:MAG: ankyrin repeat domain-containing protein [Deltaproteobacteria bacterium]|nr:ankyrin repeat domain-containing protein [Deltaproteobacteria bacterium]